MNEYDEIKEVPKKKVTIQVIFLILLAIAIASMIGAIITVKNYGEMLKNPVGYNMEKFNLAYCTCYNTQNQIIPIKSKLFNDSFNSYVPNQLNPIKLN